VSVILAVEFGIPPGLHRQIDETKKARGQSDRQTVELLFDLGTRIEKASFTPGQEIHVQRNDTGTDTTLALFGDRFLFGNPTLDWALNKLAKRGLIPTQFDTDVHLDFPPLTHVRLLQWSQQRQITPAAYVRELVIMGGVLDRAMLSSAHTVWVPGETGRQIINRRPAAA
jgi:hypothetical protein